MDHDPDTHRPQLGHETSRSIVSQRPPEWQTGTRHLNRRLRIHRFALWLLIPALVVWIAPMIVAHTPLRQILIDVAVGSRLNGRLRCASASFGWISPVRLYGLELTDVDGRKIATVDTISSDRSLVGLALHRDNPGTFVVERPNVQLILRQDGSNLEDAIAPLLAGPSSGGHLTTTIQLTDGLIEIQDAATKRQWQVQRLDATVQTPPDSNQPLTAEARGQLTADDQTTGMFEGSISWRASVGGKSSLGEGDVKIQTETLPLSVVTPLLRRFVGTIDVTGSLTIDGRYTWSDDPSGQLSPENDGQPSGALARESPDDQTEPRGIGGVGSQLLKLTQRLEINDLASDQLTVVARRWLGPDPLVTPSIKARGALQLTRGRCEVRDLDFESGLGNLRADGGFPLSILATGDIRTAMSAILKNEDFAVKGELDLAQLARTFPSVLRVREGTEITSGKLLAELTSRLDREQRHWEGRIESSNLVAENEGRRITWEQPLQAALSVFQSPSGLVVEKLLCQSSFLQAEAQGRASNGEFIIQSDLTQLEQELARFLALGDTKLAGKLRADLTWKQASDQRLTARGEARLDQFELVFGQTRPWREQELVVTFAASGFGNRQGIGRLDSATVRIEAAGDHLQLELAEPLVNLTRETPWPVRGRLFGELGRWLPRVQAFLPLSGWALGGHADIAVDARLHAGGVSVTSAKMDFSNLLAVSDSIAVREPQVKIDGAGSWDRVRNQLQVRAVTCTSSALAIRADDVTVAPQNEKWVVAANVGFRTDLARLSVWLGDPKAPHDWQLAGMATGQLKLGTAAGSTSARWAVEIENLLYARAVQAARQAAGPITRPAIANVPEFETVWEEPKLRLSGQGSYATLQNLVRLTNAEVECNAFKVTAAGTITEPGNHCVVVLDGNVAYNLDEITRRLRPRLGQAVEFQGRDTRPFRVRGPIRQLSIADDGPGRVQFVNNSREAPPPRANAWPPAELSGEAGLAWASAYAYGLPFGPGQVDARLEQAVLEVRALNLDVSEGRLHLTPKILLNRPDMLMVADKGPVLENVRISPEMCAMWLKFVLPVVADVADVEGKFSADLLDTAAMPLTDPLGGEVEGQITVQAVQVGPGPMAREMISLAQLIKSIVDKRPLPQDGVQQRVWLQLPQQAIPFHLKQRRVYHENLTVSVKDVALVTRGSVGLDHTLDMMAYIPIRDEWVSANRYLASLKGQQIQVPISGTLSAPRIDRRALQQIATQTITNSASKALEQEVTRGLDRLLRPRTTPTPGTSAPPGTPPPIRPSQP